MSTYEEIISAALALPPGARAMLAEHLLESLDGADWQLCTIGGHPITGRTEVND